MPNSVPGYMFLVYVFDNHFFKGVFVSWITEKPPQNDKDFIRMKYIGLSDIINIFAVQK